MIPLSSQCTHWIYIFTCILIRFTCKNWIRLNVSWELHFLRERVYFLILIHKVRPRLSFDISDPLIIYAFFGILSVTSFNIGIALRFTFSILWIRDMDIGKILTILFDKTATPQHRTVWFELVIWNEVPGYVIDGIKLHRR